MPRTRKSWTTRRAMLALIAAWLLAATAALATAQSYAGRSLDEALRDLQSQGLEIFFTSNVVRPWPTTAVMGALDEDDEGEVEIVPVIGPFNAERLPSYHRLDLRASREWYKRNGVLGFYFEIQNVYDRENIAGFDVDFEFELRDDGQIDVIALEEVWGGFLPSFGITWEF